MSGSSYSVAGLLFAAAANININKSLDPAIEVQRCGGLVSRATSHKYDFDGYGDTVGSDVGLVGATVGLHVGGAGPNI